jgi:hypothetical protein
MTRAWYGVLETESGRWKTGNPAESNGAGFPLSQRPGGDGGIVF